MLSFPEALPSPNLNAIQIGSPQGGVIRTEMGSGPAKQRRRFTGAPRPVSLSFIFNEAQLGAFEGFFDQDIAGGALPFSMPHPITGATATFRFVMSGEAYSISPVGNNALKVSVSMEMLP